MSKASPRAMTAFLCVGGAIVLLCAGCVEQEIDEAFQRTREVVAERAGETELAWIRDQATEEQVAQRVADLLEDELTIDEAVQIALLNNRQLQATYSQVGIGAARVVEAWLIENPVVDAEVRFAHGQPFWEMAVVQNFLDVLLIPLAVELSEAQLEAAQLRVAGQVIDVAADTRRAFYRYQARLQMLDMWRDLLLAAESSYEMALELRRAGNISELVLAREQTAYEAMKLDVADAQLEAVNERERLNVLMGLWGAATTWRAKPQLPPLPEEPPEHADVEREVVEASVDLRAALLDVSVAAQRLGLSSIETALPELALGVALENERPTEYELNEVPNPGGTGNAYELEERQMEEWLVGPAFAVPIPIWNFGQAAYATGRMEILQNWHEFTALAISIRAAARTAEFRVRTAHQRALFTERTYLRVWDDVFQQAHLQYNGMFLGIFDLLTTKQQQLRAYQQGIGVLAAYWLARTDLEQLLAGSASGMRFDRGPVLGGAMNRTLGMAGGPAEGNGGGH